MKKFKKIIQKTVRGTLLYLGAGIMAISISNYSQGQEIIKFENEKLTQKSITNFKWDERPNKDSILISYTNNNEDKIQLRIPLSKRSKYENIHENKLDFDARKLKNGWYVIIEESIKIRNNNKTGKTKEDKE